LKELEEAGIVERRVLPRPSGAIVYELTAYGRELDGILLGLARWGAQTLGDPQGEVTVSPAALVLGLRASFRPQAAGDLRAVFALQVEDAVVHARVADGALEAGEGPAADADVTITSDLSLREVIAGEQSPADAGVRAEGDTSLVERFAEIFRLERSSGAT
jgi:hypothetical protein